MRSPHNEQLNPGGLVFLQGPGGLLADAVPMTVTVVDPPSLTQPAGGQLELAYSSKLEIYKTDGTLVASGSTLLPFASTTLLVVGVNAMLRLTTRTWTCTMYSAVRRTYRWTMRHTPSSR